MINLPKRNGQIKIDPWNSNGISNKKISTNSCIEFLYFLK